MLISLIVYVYGGTLFTFLIKKNLISISLLIACLQDQQTKMLSQKDESAKR